MVETKDKAEKGKAASNDYTILDGKDYTILDGKDNTILDGKEWSIKDYSIDGKGAKENKGGKSDTNNPYPVPGSNIVLGRK